MIASIKKFALLACYMTLGACALPPTQKQVESADYGAYPYDYEKIVVRYMNSVLKEPGSAKFEFINQPHTGWSAIGGLKFGYVVCVNINARNSFGGYTGSRVSYFLIKNDAVDLAFHDDGRPGSLARVACQSVT